LLDWVKTLVRSRRQAPGQKKIVKRIPLKPQGRVILKRKVPPQPKLGSRGGIAKRGQPKAKQSVKKSVKKKIIKKEDPEGPRCQDK